MRTHRIANKDAHNYTTRRQLFKGSHLYSEQRDSLYVVFSYGEHFPAYVYVDGKWYENVSGYSPSTARHMTHARPHDVTITKCSTEELQAMLREAAHPTT